MYDWLELVREILHSLRAVASLKPGIYVYHLPMVFLLLYLLQFSSAVWMCEAVLYCLISQWHCSVWGTIFNYLIGMMNKFMFLFSQLRHYCGHGRTC
jgi:hypothetical protein